MKASDISDLVALRAVRDHATKGGPIDKTQPYVRVGVEQMLQGFPPKVIEAKMRKFMGRGWINYGVSLRTASLEPAGKARLAELEAQA